MSDTPKPTKNIVQAEFFPPEGILKTNVRFYDEHGHIKKMVDDYVANEAELERRRDEHRPGERGLLGRVFIQNPIDALFRRRENLTGQARALIPGQMMAVIRGSRQIAVELPDRHFRMAKEEDYADLMVKARAAKSIWVFLFEPEDLLVVDGLKSAGRMM